MNLVCVLMVSVVGESVIDTVSLHFEMFLKFSDKKYKYMTSM